MSKSFIDRKYIENHCSKDMGTFYMKDDYILSSFAKDFFIQNKIKISYDEPVETCTEENITYPSHLFDNCKGEDCTDIKTCNCRIAMIGHLLKCYNVKNEDVDKITKTVLEKLSH